MQRSFIPECEAVYHRMLRSPLEHQLKGFVEWEFISLLGAVLRGEAKDVFASFLDKWDFKNEDYANLDATIFLPSYPTALPSFKL